MSGQFYFLLIGVLILALGIILYRIGVKGNNDSNTLRNSNLKTNSNKFLKSIGLRIIILGSLLTIFALIRTISS